MKIAAFPGVIGSLAQTFARPMSRDKSDTLLLLAACALVMAPHAGHLPWWVILISGFLLLWRGWITFSGNMLPRRWILLPLAAMSMTGVYWTNKSFLGREAGVTMLVLLLALKLLEMRARRDLFVVVFLSFFLVLTNLFYSQSIMTALSMIAAVILMLTAQLSFQYANSTPPLKQRLALGSMIFALAVPLTLVLFILFPRVQGPLWGLPNDAFAGRTGLSDNMAPGNISNLALSSEIVFRVKFFDAMPAKPQLYWRGPVLGDYDGRTWTPLRPHGEAQRTVAVKSRNASIRYQVTLEPNGRHSLFALEMPRVAPLLPDNAARIMPDMQLLTRQPINQRIRYEMVSDVEFELQPDESPDAMQNWLRLPPGYNPQTLAFAERLRSQSSDNSQLIRKVLQYFREQEFRYTLEPPLLGKHAVDDFLFSTRAGFCEHYASSFVVLMRALGIPARVVTGYQGGELNAIDGFMTVRQSDAHAWAEVWLDRRGWLRVDPTAAVAPNRVERNLRSTIAPTVLGGLVILDIGENSWLAKLQVLRQNWEAINNAWNQWVLDYGPAKQRSFMESLGFEHADWQTLTALMLAFGTVIMALILIPLLKSRPQADPVDMLYQRLCQQMARQGCARALHEGPRSYRARLAADASSMAPRSRAAAIRFLVLYEELRYGPEAGRNPPAAAVSQLKSLLAESR